MIDKCHIVEEDSTGITIEIDLIQHRKLLDDLANNFFTKKIRRRKNWTRLFCWKSVFNNKNLQWLQFTICECYVSISIQDVTNSGWLIIKLELEKLVALISVI